MRERRMIVFKSVSFKNFLSFGDRVTTINLDTRKKTLLIGNSGSGKSSIIVESITFALFGKPFRKIKKGELVNRVNLKDCLVTLELEVNGVAYTIKRGMKPDVFQIFMEGKLVNQDPSVRDYQDYLETNILKINYKTFCQICVIGYANFTPFMLLSAGDRRIMVDEILGTQIFIKMYHKIRETMTNTKNQVLLIDTNISNFKSSIELQNSNLVKFRAQEKERENILTAEISEYNDAIDKLMAEIQEIQDKIQAISVDKEELQKLRNREKDIQKLINKFEATQREKEKTKTFFDVNDHCPTCRQDMAPSHKDPIIEKISEEITELSSNVDVLSDKLTECAQNITLILEKINQINQLEVMIFKKNESVKNANATIAAKQKEISKLVGSDSSVIKDIQESISNIQEEMSETLKAKEKIQEEVKYLLVAQSLLKDDGIRARIIKEYIPVLNKLMNEYLDVMNFNMRVELNEAFEERILSRFRDEMSYGMLSQGEQSRVSLAMTLAWRKLAELRNSARINCLVLDETLDATISATDLESIISLLSEIAKDTSLFIISHKPQSLMNYCDSTIQVEKHGNFSSITLGE